MDNKTIIILIVLGLPSILIPILIMVLSQDHCISIIEYMSPQAIVILPIVLLFLIIALMIWIALTQTDQTFKKTPKKTKKIKPNSHKPNLRYYKGYKWNFFPNHYGSHDIEVIPFCDEHRIRFVEDDHHRLYCPDCDNSESHDKSETNKLYDEICNIFHSKGIKYFPKNKRKYKFRFIEHKDIEL